MSILIAFLVVFSLFIGGFIWIAWKGAARDKFFTSGVTNEAKIVVRGARKKKKDGNEPDEFADELIGGEFIRCIMPPGEYILNDPKSVNFVPSQRPWEVLRKDPSIPGNMSDVEIEKRYIDERSFLARYFNIYWVGIWPFDKVLKYVFEWAEEKQVIGAEHEFLGFHPESRKALTTSVFVKPHPYTIFIPAAEISGGFTVDIKIVVTVRIVNPYHAIYKTDNWFRQMTSSATRAILGYVRDKEFDELASREVGSDKGDGSQRRASGLARTIVSLSHHLPDSKDQEKIPVEETQGGGSHGLITFYGVEILQAEVQAVELSDKELSKEEREATRYVYIAEQRKKAAIKEAEGARKADMLRGEGTAKAYERVGKVMQKNPQAAQYARLRAFTDTGIRTLATGDTSLLIGENGDTPPQPPREEEAEAETSSSS